MLGGIKPQTYIGTYAKEKGTEEEHRTCVDGFTQLNNSLTLQSVLLTWTERMWALMQRKPTIWTAKEDKREGLGKRKTEKGKLIHDLTNRRKSRFGKQEKKETDTDQATETF